MKYIKKITGALIIGNLLPLGVWALWQYDYKPDGWFDAWLNSFHPYVAGCIVELIIAAAVGVTFLGLHLLLGKQTKS